MGLNYSAMNRDFKDALAWIGKPSPTLGEGNVRLRVDYFLCSREWKPTDGGVHASDASDHDLIWMDATAATGHAGPATQPAVAASDR